MASCSMFRGPYAKIYLDVPMAKRKWSICDPLQSWPILDLFKIQTHTQIAIWRAAALFVQIK